jgi:hypothetical protein
MPAHSNKCDSADQVEKTRQTLNLKGWVCSGGLVGEHECLISLCKGDDSEN